MFLKTTTPPQAGETAKAFRDKRLDFFALELPPGNGLAT
jgi:hypothetical protein